jgi:hypothetical protein
MAWEQYRSIRESAAQDAAVLRDQEPTNCPNDGTNLDTGPDGELHCPFDGWIWQGEPVTW